MTLTRYWKAIIAGFVALFTVVQAFVTDPEVGKAVLDGQITNEEAIRIVVVLAGVIGVYFKRNLPPVGQAADPNVSEAAR